MGCSGQRGWSENDLVVAAPHNVKVSCHDRTNLIEQTYRGHVDHFTQSFHPSTTSGEISVMNTDWESLRCRVPWMRSDAVESRSETASGRRQL